VSKRLNAVQAKSSKQKVAGMIVALRTMKTKQGNTMAALTLDDRTGRIEVSVFAKVFAELRELLIKDAIVVVEGVIRNDDYTKGLSIRADRIQSLDQARSDHIHSIEIDYTNQPLTGEVINSLKALLQKKTDPLSVNSDASCPISIQYSNGEVTTRINLGSEWRVTPGEQILNQLKELCGEKSVKVRYRDRNSNVLDFAKSQYI
jgi:DNA polymerase-3 subunit alpha